MAQLITNYANSASPVIRDSPHPYACSVLNDVIQNDVTSFFFSVLILDLINSLVGISFYLDWE